MVASAIKRIAATCVNNVLYKSYQKNIHNFVQIRQSREKHYVLSTFVIQFHKHLASILLEPSEYQRGSLKAVLDSKAPFIYGPLQASLARCLAPIRAYTIGVGHRTNSIINMAALNLRHVVRVLIAFLKC